MRAKSGKANFSGRTTKSRKQSKHNHGRWRIVLAGFGVLAALTVAVVVPVIGRFGARSGFAIPDPDLSRAEPQVTSLLVQLRSELVAQPSSAEAWGKFGAACDAHNLIDDADHCYARASTLAPQDFRWSYLQAMLADRKGRPNDEVIESYNRVLTLSRDYVPARCRLADAHFRHGDLREALFQFQTVLAADDSLATAHRGLGQTMLGIGDLEAARTHLQRADELMPGDAAVNAALSQVFARLGDIDRSSHHARIAHQSNATILLPDPVYHMVQSLAMTSSDLEARSKVLLAGGDAASAIAALLVLEQRYPESASVQSRLGRAYLETNQPEQAAAHFRRALEIDNSLEGAHVGMANILESAQNAPAAIDHYQSALRLNPGRFDVRKRLARLYISVGSPRAATQVFEEADDIDERDAESHVLWGNALLLTGDTTKACDHYERALAIDERLPEAHFNLSTARERQGDVDRANFHLRRAAELDPNNTVIQSKLAKIDAKPR